MSEEQTQEPKPEITREERRLERLRLIAVTPEQTWDEDDDPGPQAA
jgi:hypothetical protein